MRSLSSSRKARDSSSPCRTLSLPSPPAWGYWVFLVHVAVALDLVLLAPFMKLAHAVYRPVALFFVALATDGKAADS